MHRPHRVATSLIIVALICIGTPRAPAIGATTCTFLARQRLSRPPATKESRVLFVYVLPSDAPDGRLDLPKGCSDGSFRHSTLDLAYRDISTWMAKTLNATIGSRRFATPTHVSTNPHTGSRKTFYAAYAIRSGASSATWGCWSPTEKLANLRNLLASRGFVATNFVYMVVLDAKQTCGAKGVAGAAYSGTAGTPFGIGYGLRYTWTGTGYRRQSFGCGNQTGDAVLVHELLHVLGAVPYTASHSDGAGHIKSDGDALEPVIDFPFANRSGATRLRFDAGINDYRSSVMRGPWDTTGYGTSKKYRLC